MVRATEQIDLNNSDAGQTLKSGLSGIDSALEGGYSKGDVVAVQFPAESSGVELAYALATEPTHPTMYLTTLRPETLVETEIRSERQRGLGTEQAEFAVRYAEDGDLGEFSSTYGTSALGASFVVDTFLDYAEDDDDWRTALTDIVSTARQTSSVVYLLLHPPEWDTQLPIVQKTNHVADVVMEYQIGESQQGHDILNILKARRCNITESLPLRLELDVNQNGIGVSTKRSFK